MIKKSLGVKEYIGMTQEEQSAANPKQLDQLFAMSLFSALDEAGRSSVIATMTTLLDNRSHEEAVVAGNKILTVSGKTSVSYPLPV